MMTSFFNLIGSLLYGFFQNNEHQTHRLRITRLKFSTFISITSSMVVSRGIRLACARYHITSPSSLLRWKMLSSFTGLPWNTIFFTTSVNSPLSNNSPPTAVARSLGMKSLAFQLLKTIDESFVIFTQY